MEPEISFTSLLRNFAGDEQYVRTIAEEQISPVECLSLIETNRGVRLVVVSDYIDEEDAGYSEWLEQYGFRPAGFLKIQNAGEGSGPLHPSVMQYDKAVRERQKMCVWQDPGSFNRYIVFLVTPTE